jgi:hypothetical protein
MTQVFGAVDVKALARIARLRTSTAEALDRCAGHGPSIDRLLARHPNASAVLLDQLSHSSDRITRKAVTLHPNTPIEVLVRLAPQFPGDFFKNTAFDWLLVEQPNLMFEIGGGVLKNVLKRADCPESFLAWAAACGSELERLAVTMNPRAQPEVLLAIERKGGKAARGAQQHLNHPFVRDEVDIETAFRQAVAQAIADEFRNNDLPSLAQWPALSLEERLPGFFVEVCVELCSHRLAPPEVASQILTALASDSNSNVRCAVASNHAVPVAVLSTLLRDEDEDIRRTVSLNPRAPRGALEDLLKTLSHDSDLDVYAQIANSPSTPISILTALARTDKPQTVRCVAGNRSTPNDVLVELSISPDAGVRASVASNQSASPYLLAVLAEDSRADVRLRVAENRTTPTFILTHLAEDSSDTVQCAVAKNPAAPTDVLARLSLHTSKYVRRGVAENPEAPMDVRQSILSCLAGDTDLEMRCNLAKNSVTPASVLTKLANSSKVVIRRAVAANAATPVLTLIKLSKDRSFQVRCEVAGNPSTPEEVLDQLIAKEPHSRMYESAIGNPSIPATLVAKLCDEARKMLFDFRSTAWWLHQIDQIALRHQEVADSCRSGDLLYLRSKLVGKACRKSKLAWRLLGLSHSQAVPADLAKRSRSVEWVERMAVARNVNTPRSVIQALRKDPHRLVARQANATAAIRSLEVNSQIRGN